VGEARGNTLERARAAFVLVAELLAALGELEGDALVGAADRLADLVDGGDRHQRARERDRDVLGGGERKVRAKRSRQRAPAREARHHAEDDGELREEVPAPVLEARVHRDAHEEGDDAQDERAREAAGVRDRHEDGDAARKEGQAETETVVDPFHPAEAGEDDERRGDLDGETLARKVAHGEDADDERVERDDHGESPPRRHSSHVLEDTPPYGLEPSASVRLLQVYVHAHASEPKHTASFPPDPMLIGPLALRSRVLGLGRAEYPVTDVQVRSGP